MTPDSIRGSDDEIDITLVGVEDLSRRSGAVSRQLDYAGVPPAIKDSIADVNSLHVVFFLFLICFLFGFLFFITVCVDV